MVAESITQTVAERLAETGEIVLPFDGTQADLKRKREQVRAGALVLGRIVVTERRGNEIHGTLSE